MYIKNIRSESLTNKGTRTLGSRKEIMLNLDEERITIERNCRNITTTFHVLRRVECTTNTVRNKYRNRFGDLITFINNSKVLEEKWTIVKVEID